MDIMEIIVDFHKNADRQSPGSDTATFQALSAIPDYKNINTILDIGCGTGAQTMTLMRHTNANVTAIDLLPGFLSELNKRAEKQGFGERVYTVKMSMDALEFPAHHFDVIWAEGSIYHIGFEKGLRYWKRFLRAGGYLVVSEVCWLSEKRPVEIEEYWMKEYSEIDTIQNKLEIIRRCGYECINHAVLPESAWADNYYTPIVQRTPAFAKLHEGSSEVLDFLNDGLREAALYDQYKDYYSYVHFVLKPNIEWQ